MSEAFIKAVIGVIVTASWTACIALIKRAFKKQKETEKRQEAVENGLKSLLRAEIIRTYEKTKDRGYCPIYAKQALSDCFSSYTGLDGNGTMPNLYNYVMDAPTDKPKK